MGNTPNQNKDTLIEAVKNIVSFMNLECQVETREEVESDGKTLLVSLRTPENARFIIGKNGQNLKAFEQVIRAMFLKSIAEFKNIILDVNDYRKSRASFVLDLARQAVTRVRNTQKAEALSPMSAYERRVVHMELASFPDIATESIGSEPQRRIVVKPYRVI